MAIIQYKPPCRPGLLAAALARVPTGVATNSGADNIGAYSEIAFNYASGASRSAAIRLYQNLRPPVLFTHTYLAASTNDLAFPKLTTLPAAGISSTIRMSGFSPMTLASLHGDSPWMFFDTNYNSFVISPAANFSDRQRFQKWQRCDFLCASIPASPTCRRGFTSSSNPGGSKWN